MWRFSASYFQIFFDLGAVAINKTSESHVTAALTLKVPQKVGWSVQREEQSWTGKHLAELSDCMAQIGNGDPVTFSISMIFELMGNEGTVVVGDSPGG
tara:strand:+ start:2719 stop:3012 length:294 start_codon:yes stop_codon:yes gene_type:complete